MQVSAQFGLLSLFPYAVYLVLAWVLAYRLNIWLALSISTLGWAVAAVIIFLSWNSVGASGTTTMQVVRISGENHRHRSELFSENQNANLLFLRSHYPWESRDSVGLCEGIDLLEQAVKLDPKFARGWAALAASYPLLPVRDARQRAAAYRKTLAATRRARSLSL